MKIYTRTGDQGETSVIGGRVLKDDLRVEAYGTIDELNCFIGQAVSQMNQDYDDMKHHLLHIQNELFDCGSDLAYARPDQASAAAAQTMIDRLEEWIDRYDQETERITQFILPGGSLIASALHVCRAVCRRAERRVVTLAGRDEINVTVRVYLNRLSDLLFTMARAANVREGIKDVQYKRSGGDSTTRP